MLVRSLRIQPAILLFLAFCAIFGWHLSSGAEPERPAPIVNPPPPPAPPPPAPAKSNTPPRIAVVTFVTEERSYLHLSLKNKDHYARRHGYDFIVDYESHTDRGTTYYKFNMMERLVKEGKWDWIWWIDFDTLITNTEIKVGDIIANHLKDMPKPDEIDYLLTHDCNGLNLGSFAVRGHERSMKFLHDVYAIHDAGKAKEENLSEQDSMVRLLKDDPVSASRTTKVPQYLMNAFPKEIACFDEEHKVWSPGAFVLHFAGAWAHVKGEDPTGQLMKKYENEIIWGDWRGFYGGDEKGKVIEAKTKES
ncbi:galactosyl transferase GMA12/MNN10 family-domain-containing protein [Dendryphion nanum]|uniref:Galactosyl transferase GMA12/MNN10 family-domain-containing protein n=1 Tax=Dendryphion nanum TaxID=256645 RepID=A0A9P9DRQ5_9PLEO|nr:galactosyl transferase GMA12/MNN10 family-domain-containing protein [Dendryphion nanum]